MTRKSIEFPAHKNATFQISVGLGRAYGVELSAGYKGSTLQTKIEIPVDACERLIALLINAVALEKQKQAFQEQMAKALEMTEGP